MMDASLRNPSRSLVVPILAFFMATAPSRKRPRLTVQVALAANSQSTSNSELLTASGRGALLPSCAA